MNNNLNDSFLSSIIAKQDALTRLLTLKCDELGYIMSQMKSTGKKPDFMNSFNNSLNSTLKLILEEEKYISEYLSKLRTGEKKLQMPNPFFLDDDKSKEKFDSWNPEINIPQEVSYKRVYDIPESKE